MCATVFRETVDYHITRHGFSLEDLAFGDPGDTGVALGGDRLFVASRRAAGRVPITIRVDDHEPALDHDPWTRVVDVALRIRSLVALRTAEWEDHPLRIEPGDYTARVLFGDIESIDDDSFLGDDHYLLVLWPGLRDDGVAIRKPHDGRSTWPSPAFHGTGDVDALVEQALHGDVHARRHAVRVLGLVGSERDVATIERALSDESPFVREVAVTAASHFGSRFEDQILWCSAEPSSVMPGDDRAVWCRCAEALGRIGSRLAGDRLEEMLSGSTDSYVRAWAARSLAATRDPYWLDALGAHADDDDAYVRQTVDEAIRTLTRIRSA